MFKLPIKTYTVVYDNNGIILDVTTNKTTARVLHKWYDNVFFEQIGLNSISVFIVSFFYKRNYITLFTFNTKTRKIETTKSFFTTDTVRDFSSLLRYKSKILARVLSVVSTARYQLISDVSLQDIVYQKKEAEAQRFIDLHLSDETYSPIEYPFLYQYSSLEKISAQQAAQEILLKSSFSADILLKTESLRLEYLKRIKNATTMAELHIISLDFSSDTGKNI